MKLIGTLALSAQIAFADFDSIFGQFHQMLKANNLSIPGQLGAGLRAGGNRDFVDPILNALLPMRDYGCWCHFGEDWPKAGGQVKDGVDMRCKQLVNGYRCAKMDGIDRGDECNAALVSYTTYNYFGGQPIDVDCAAGNPGDLCAEAACIIEGQFTLDYLVQITAQTVQSLLNPIYQAGNGWVRENECLTGTMKAHHEHACCGVHPTRAPFSVSTGTHDCCGDVSLFSVGTHECCVDPLDSSLSVELLGSC